MYALTEHFIPAPWCTWSALTEPYVFFMFIFIFLYVLDLEFAPAEDVGGAIA